MAALAERREPDFGPPDEQAVYRLATEILGCPPIQCGLGVLDPPG